MWGSITAPLLLQYLYRKLNPPVIPVLCLYPKYLPYIYIPDTLYDAANTGVSSPLFLDVMIPGPEAGQCVAHVP